MTARVACHGARLVDVVCQVDVDHFQTKRIKFSKETQTQIVCFFRKTVRINIIDVSCKSGDLQKCRFCPIYASNDHHCRSFRFELNTFGCPLVLGAHIMCQHSRLSSQLEYRDDVRGVGSWCPSVRVYFFQSCVHSSVMVLCVLPERTSAQPVYTPTKKSSSTWCNRCYPKFSSFTTSSIVLISLIRRK